MYDTGYITEEQRDAAKGRAPALPVVTVDTPGHAGVCCRDRPPAVFGQYGDGEVYTRGMMSA